MHLAHYGWQRSPLTALPRNLPAVGIRAHGCEHGRSFSATMAHADIARNASCSADRRAVGPALTSGHLPLRQLPVRSHEMVRVAFRVSLKVILVLRLGLPEIACGR